MNTEIKINDQQELQSEQTAREQAAKPAWLAPQCTRIDIKKTMFAPGSFFDGVTIGFFD